MSSEWLTAESFERNQRLISAINTLSIHTKLSLEGVADVPNDDDIPAAKQELRTFLNRLDPLLRTVEANQEAPILGTDPRFGLLVRQFASARKLRPASPLHTLPIGTVSALLDSEQPADQEKLVRYLRALRQLVEQHAHADVVGLLGGEV
jgi:hypothetical protein